MSELLPTITILIAARPNQVEIKAVTASRQLDYPSDKLEILVARGKQPSVQRNAALRAARGELIYFLDDDSVPPPEALRKAASHFKDDNVKMMGGPNLCPTDAPKLEQVFAVTLSSWLAFGPSRARYAAVGKRRETSEKELILCNLLARRDALVMLGGFNEALYPNEENALMDELQKRGGKLLYDPRFVVYRRPRHSLGAFVNMLLNYGRGRAEQFRLHPTLGSTLNFAPPVFCLYLMLLPLLIALSPWHIHLERTTGTGAMLRLNVAWLPLVAYAVALLMQTGASAREHGFLNSFVAMPLLALTHIFYGLGFWRGMLTNLSTGRPKQPTEVTLERFESGST